MPVLLPIIPVFAPATRIVVLLLLLAFMIYVLFIKKALLPADMLLFIVPILPDYSLSLEFLMEAFFEFKPV